MTTVSDTTRIRIIALLRRGARTVDELARSLGLTPNAVRNHLAALERDGVARHAGVRRREGAGKPAAVFEMRADAEPRFSTAYPPALAAVVKALTETLSPRQSRALLRTAGRRLALALPAPDDGTLVERARRAADVLAGMGALIEVETERRTVRLRGASCPLSAVVSHSPETCQLMGALVGEMTGARARVCCEHGDRPRCCFELEPAS